MSPDDAADWQQWFDELVSTGRAAVAETADGDQLWFAAENLRAIEPSIRAAASSRTVSLPPASTAKPTKTISARAPPRAHGMPRPRDRRRTRRAHRASPSPRRPPASRSSRARASSCAGASGPGADGDEFCDRRLLARIHRYTLDRLRQEIEPVTAQDFMRFLLRWQHLAPGTQLEGKRGLLEAVAQLQGFDIPAVAWERHILPARVASYKGSWLDELCLSGDVSWGRLGSKKNGLTAPTATPVRNLLRHPHLPLPPRRPVMAPRWPPATESAPPHDRTESSPQALSLTGASRDILELLAARGALFYDDIVQASGRLPTDVERGLWDLVARGLVTADGFQALRSLMASSKRRAVPPPPARQALPHPRRRLPLRPLVPATR